MEHEKVDGEATLKWIKSQVSVYDVMNEHTYFPLAMV